MHIDRVQECSVASYELNEIWALECDGMVQSCPSSSIFCLQVGTASEQNLCDSNVALSAGQNQTSEAVDVARFGREPAMYKFADHFRFAGTASTDELNLRFRSH